MHRNWLLALAPISLAACSPSADLAATDTAVAGFHSSLNAGRFDAIYDGGSADLKSSATREKMTALLTAVHRKLGAFKKGSQVGWNDNLNTSGHYVTVNYTSTYERGQADEQFVFVVNGGKSSLAGYHVNSDALILN